MGMNGIAKFDCVASGNPPPSVFWTKEGSQDLMFTGTTHGQMQVTAEGTLMINVRTIRIEACLFNEYFYKASHSKVVKERALHVHQTKTKHFIAKLFAQPVDS